ncbi:AraC family transcriptional regulator [Sorangium sp. So ce854]|uniref:AraC family transcriptional regulator n=1 Tax=Sorangium sp. So ce854 TaxID=3133322 RepID=UPI003F60E74C
MVSPRRGLDPLVKAEGERALSVGVKALRSVLGAAEAAGLDASSLARAHGLAPEELRNPDFRLSYRRWIALWDDVVERAGDPGVGLRAAEALSIGHWDVMDYVVASSDTVGDAFQRFSRHFAVISTAVRHVLQVDREEARLVRQHAPGAAPHRVATEFGFANIVLRFRALAATPWSPSSIQFRHPRCAELETYTRIFACPVRFRAPGDAIVLPRAALATPMKGAAPELCAVLERHATLLMQRLPPAQASLVERARHALALELHGGAPRLSTVAKRLGLSARTLQRRLSEDGWPFRALVEKTREELALRYLEDPAIGLAEVGSLVGFSDVSAFYKAFRRWTGSTPGQLRERSVA